jgi:hypothetical protein
VDNIFDDIKKGVTTRSRVATFYQYHSFASSLKPFKVENALHDPDWVVAMQEELNNLKRNKEFLPDIVQPLPYFDRPSQIQIDST